MSVLLRSVVALCLMAALWPATAQQMEHPPPPKAAPRVEVTEIPLPQPGGVMIFGVSEEFGSDLSKRLRSQGLEVSVMVRSLAVAPELEAAGVKVIVGAIANYSDVVAAIRSGPLRAIIALAENDPSDYRNTLGGSKNVFDAADALGVSRVVLLTGIGAGSSETALPWYRRILRGRQFEAKTAAEVALRDSELDFTIIRSGPMLDGDETDTATLSEDSSRYSAITPRNLSELVSSALDDKTAYGKTLTIFDPTLAGFWSFSR